METRLKIPGNPNIRMAWSRCQVDPVDALSKPMYACAGEIVALIKAGLTEATGLAHESVRTVESGIVEEHAVVARMPDKKSLLFRMWPVFFSHEKRVEYSLFTADPTLVPLIMSHLRAFAAANGARLVEKR